MYSETQVTSLLTVFLFSVLRQKVTVGTKIEIREPVDQKQQQTCKYYNLDLNKGGKKENKQLLFEEIKFKICKFNSIMVPKIEKSKH